MAINSLTYMIGAAIVGILHMSAPDHWLTLCLLAKNRRWTPKKLLGTSFATAIGHAALSIVMGLVVVAVGLLVSRLISSYIDMGIGIIMITIGAVLGIIPLLRNHSHHKHDHKHDHPHDHEKEHTHDHEHDDIEKRPGKLSQKLGYFVIIGAALSPDPSIIPIYLSTISSGFYFALELSVVFTVASILTLLILVQLGNVGFAKTFARLPEKYHDSMVGFVIAAIGIYILVSGYVG